MFFLSDLSFPTMEKIMTQGRSCSVCILPSQREGSECPGCVDVKEPYRCDILIGRSMSLILKP